MDYKEIIKERLGLLSPELRAFMADESWRREAEKIGKQFNLSEEKYASFENEIFLILLCFELPDSFAENIKKELEIDPDTAKWMTEDVSKNIFSKVSNEINAIWGEMGQVTNLGQSEVKTSSQKDVGLAPHSSNAERSDVGTDFEQIILNQARAMQPAQAPGNLPTNPEPQIKTPDYSSNDPYREPIE